MADHKLVGVLQEETFAQHDDLGTAADQAETGLLSVGDPGLGAKERQSLNSWRTEDLSKFLSDLPKVSVYFW